MSEEFKKLINTYENCTSHDKKKYKLSIDETRNTMKYIEIETNLNDIELDALLTKIENNSEITSSEILVKKLKSQNVKVISVIPATHDYYTESTVLEIEELEE
jgi:hypothetical protein